LNPVLSNYLKKNQVNARITHPIGQNPALIVVIPSSGEHFLNKVIENLYSQEYPNCNVCIIISINESTKHSHVVHEANLQTIKQLEELKSQAPKWLNLTYFYERHIPANIAGAGIARKLGMDEAIVCFSKFSAPIQAIVNLDADCKISSNYLKEIFLFYKSNPKSVGCNIYFEHQVDEPLLTYENQKAIIEYELYLRYLTEGFDYCGLPYAFHTVGSSFTVSAKAYCLCGGMNKRTAGEDFYFINKLFAFDDYSNLNTATVFPSARSNSLLPFGTGAAVKDIIEKGNLFCYPFSLFRDFKKIITYLKESYSSRTLINKDQIPDIFFKPNLLTRFQNIQIECFNNSSNEKTFLKRLFSHISMFFLIQLFNETCRNDIEKQYIGNAANELITNLGITTESKDAEFLLNLYRKYHLDKLNV